MPDTLHCVTKIWSASHYSEKRRWSPLGQTSSGHWFREAFHFKGLPNRR